MLSIEGLRQLGIPEEKLASILELAAATAGSSSTSNVGGGPLLYDHLGRQVPNVAPQQQAAYQQPPAQVVQPAQQAAIVQPPGAQQQVVQQQVPAQGGIVMPPAAAQQPAQQSQDISAVVRQILTETLQAQAPAQQQQVPQQQQQAPAQQQQDQPAGQQSIRRSKADEVLQASLDKLTEMVTTMQDERSKEKQAADLAEYRNTLLSSVGETIIPEMVQGSSKEELNASFVAAQHAYQKLANTLVTATAKQLTPKQTQQQQAAATVSSSATAVNTGAAPQSVELDASNIGQLAANAVNTGTYDGSIRDILLKAGKLAVDSAQQPAQQTSIVANPQQQSGQLPASTVPSVNSNDIMHMNVEQLLTKHASSMKGKNVPQNRVLSLDRTQHPQLGADNVSAQMGATGARAAG